MSEQNYPRTRQHQGMLLHKLTKELPGPLAGFAQLHKNAMSDGALSTQTKELLALGIAICVNCDGCIAWHVHAALRAGAMRQQVLETIGVALMMGGGPAAIYGCAALEALEQFETELAEERATQRIET